MARESEPTAIPPPPASPDPSTARTLDAAAAERNGGESLTERVRRDGPLSAGPVWDIALQLLDALGSLHTQGIAHGSVEPAKILLPDVGKQTRPLRLADAGSPRSPDLAPAPATGFDATREDLRQLGAALWFALTAEEPGSPLAWERLDAAGITPAHGALPVLLARTLTGDAAQRPPTAASLMETLNVLESFRLAVPVCPAMPGGSPRPEPVAPTPAPGLPVADDRELWTRPTRELTMPGRRRRRGRQIWGSLLLLAVGGAGGFFGGVAYEKNRAREEASLAASASAPNSPPPLATAAPEPDVPLSPSPTVSAAGIAARVERIRSLQPDVADILKYAREWRRVATLPVPAGAPFPTQAQMAQLLARFDWTDPASPGFRRTALLVVLGYSDEPPAAQGQDPSQQHADETAQALARHRITSPIYTCGLGNGTDVPEVEAAGAKGEPCVEVWVAFTLF